MKKTASFLLISALVLSRVAMAGEPVKPGDFAPDFSLKSVKGETVSLSAGETKGYIVVFYSNVCPMAVKYEQRIVELNNEFAPKGYPVVAVNSNDKDVAPGDSYDEMKKLAKKKGYKFEYVYDETQEVARKYGATNTPHVYVLSRNDGQLKVEYAGAVDNNPDDAAKADKKYVADAVNALLSGKSVPVTNSKAVGCAIKWKKA
ncbi:MAG: thioredoxin family protein [Bacteroidales bacterium]|jgi:peroxiredoxin|nr:thioredoxin family protein [Bacteroidales bacterium]